MIRTLVIKELRESLPLALVGGLAVLYALAQYTGWRVFSIISFSSSELKIPFAGDNFVSTAVLVGGSLAVFLALRQAAWEDLRGVYHYLLYRPVERSAVIGVKLVVGLVVVLAIAGLLILSYAIWAATPGKHPSPFYWSMTRPAWQAWLVLPVLYLAAFLSGIRPARWFGTRLAPLAAGAVAAIGIGALPWWWATLVGSIVMSLVLVVSIQSIAATRDY